MPTSSSSLHHDSSDSSSLVTSPSFAALPPASASPSRPRLRRRAGPDPDAGVAFRRGGGPARLTSSTLDGLRRAVVADSRSSTVRIRFGRLRSTAKNVSSLSCTTLTRSNVSQVRKALDVGRRCVGAGFADSAEAVEGRPPGRHGGGTALGGRTAGGEGGAPQLVVRVDDVGRGTDRPRLRYDYNRLCYNYDKTVDIVVLGLLRYRNLSTIPLLRRRRYDCDTATIRLHRDCSTLLGL